MTALADAIPESSAEAAQVLAQAAGEARPVRIAGAGTKPWTTPAAGGLVAQDGAPEPLVLRTRALSRILAHDAGDMTASLEAGVPLAIAQEAFARAGQRLSLDPPLGSGAEATIGGIVSSGDRGPLAHRYGGPRDLVVGATVALSDGTVARSGGTVIKNVAGYDIAKLLCGSFGTLGLILSVNVRLHPIHPAVSVLGASADAATLTAAAARIAALPAELEALDVAWEDGLGRLYARGAGPEASARGERIAEAMRGAGLDDVACLDDPDEEAAVWRERRAAQRAEDRAVLRVSAPPAQLAAVLGAAHAAGARLAGRFALGESYVAVDPASLAQLRDALPDGASSVLQDCPPDARAAIADPWGETPPAALALMRALKARFDPTGTCNPGTFVGGI